MAVERNLIYIPLCFYFIRNIRNLPGKTATIYIPLCFYFIISRIKYIVIHYDLHSTMLLLYRESRIDYGCGARIYIPLCFYFIYTEDPRRGPEAPFTFHYASTLSSRTLWSHDVDCLIYIPLCFYFIGIRTRQCDESFSLFTFHYASTLSGIHPILEQRTKIFTFHYASTLSAAERSRNETYQ